MDPVYLQRHGRPQHCRSVYSIQHCCMRKKDRTDLVPLGGNGQAHQCESS